MADNNRNQYNQNWDQNQGRFDRDDDYNQDNYYNQIRNNRNRYDRSGNFGGGSYGYQNSQQNDWNRNQDFNSTSLCCNR